MAELNLEQLLEVARRTVGPDVQVRDLGLLSAALGRVEARAFGRDVYPTVDHRAAALLHSLATTDPLAEGNLPFAWAATAVYLARQGRPAMLTDAEAFDLVTDVVFGRLGTVEMIAERLRPDPASR